MCDGFYDLPITTPAFVAILSDGSPVADREVQRVRSELHRQILSLSGARLEAASNIPCHGGRDDFDCTAQTRSESRNVIVIISDGGSVTPVKMERDSTVLVLVAPGRPIPHLYWLPSTINVEHWRQSATEFVPRIFSAAGFTAPDARLFISYRRTESADLAEQLFEELSKHNFDVFVDRYRIEVGVDFHQRILRELARHSMALFLESQTLTSAKWTRYEIAVAKSSRIGVFALHVQPGGVQIRDIDDSRRLSVSLQNGTLEDDDLRDVIERIKTEHALNQMRRRRLMRENMQRALARAGVYRQTLTNGIIEVQPAARSTRHYLVWLPNRPAEMNDFHFLATSNASVPDVTRAIVGPAAHLVGEDNARMRWLSEIAAVLSFDESRMLQVAVAMQKELL
jgi:hypothetical protein